MKAKIKTKYSKHGMLYIGVLQYDKLTLSSREYDDYTDAETWLTDRIKSEIDRKTLKENTDEFKKV